MTTTTRATRAARQLTASAALVVGTLAALAGAALAAAPTAPALPAAHAAPAVTSVSISLVNQGETTYMAVTGTRFASGASVSLGSGVSCAVQSVTATRIAVRLVVDPAAAVGSRTVVVTNPGGAAGRLRRAVRIDHGAVFRKWAVGEGAVAWGTWLVRPHFATTSATTPPSLTFSGRGVTVASERVGTDGVLHVTFTVARRAAPTWRTMTITQGLATWTVGRGLKVRPAPTVTMITPLGRGAQYQGVKVTGANFEVCPITEPSLSIGGTGVAVDGVSSALGTVMYATLTVSATASLGPHAVTVTNCDSGGSSTATGAFAVLGPPRVTRVAAIALGVERTEAFTGTNLTPATTLAASGSGITITHVQYVSTTKLRARITVSPTAAVGPHDVTATDTGPGGASTITTGVLVVDGDPTATSLSQPGIGANTTVLLTVHGTGFRRGALVRVGDTSPQGPYLEVGTPSLASAGSVVVAITALDDTPLGSVEVTVTNPDGGTTAPLPLATNPGPELTVTPSTRHAGALTVAMTAPAGAPAAEGYGLRLCTDQALTTRCSTRGVGPGRRTVGGLVPGATYWGRVIAPASGTFALAESPLVGPHLATVQLGRPRVARAAAHGGVLVVTYRRASHAGRAQRYTLRACANAQLTARCVIRTGYRSGARAAVPSTVAYVRIVAVASPGYLASSSATARVTR